MENAKKPSPFLIVFLLLAVLAVTAIDVYQDRVIEKQRYEMRWLLTHSTIRPDVPVAEATKALQGAKASAGQTQTTNVVPAPSSAKPASPAPPTAKP